MKAFAVGRYGSKDGLQMREMPEPGIGEHDVLVQVRAASVNLLDAKIRDGEFKLILPYRVPFVLGNDMAGVVLRVGPAVRSFVPGDEVYARPGKDNIGTFAELVAVHEDDLARSLADPDHGGIRCAAPGGADRVAGARRAGEPAVRSEDPYPRGVRWRRDDRDPARQAPRRTRRDDDGHDQHRTGSRTSALTWSSTTSATTSKRSCATTTWSSTASAGRRSKSPSACSDQAASPSASPARPTPPSPGRSARIPLVRLAAVLLSGRTRLRARRRHVRYSFLFMKASGEQLRAIAALVDAGTIRPVIDRVFPFESTKDAMAYVESGRAKGKIVVTMADLPLPHPVTPPAASTPATLTQIPFTEGARP